MTEHQHQTAFFAWLRLAYPQVPAFAIPNGGHRHKAVAAKMKAEGVTAGVPDILIADGNPGLFIEMKKEKGSRVSKEQKAMLERLQDSGYQVAVCYGFDEAKQAVETYLEGNREFSRRQPG